MDTDDYRTLVELLQNQLREVGAGEIADVRLYASRETDTEDLRPPSPKEHVIAMLEAFDRYLSIRDYNTFSVALARINETLTASTLEDAVFVPLSEAVETPSISLGEAPDLGSIRKDLRILVDQLRADDGSPEEME